MNDIPEQQHYSHTLETAFFNWQRDEFCAINNDSPISANTQAKKRALEIE